MVSPTPRAALAAGQGRIRCRVEDFQVDETIEMDEASGGEHLWLRVRKRGENSDHVARLLARAVGVSPRAVGYAGRKDRHALTTQWFSVQLPGRADPEHWNLPESVEILESRRRLRKLQTGGLRGNRFVIVVRDFSGDAAALDTRLSEIRTRGVPNYFGIQRFGRDGGNITQALAWFGGGREPRDRKLRGLLISAARAELFNAILARRVEQGSWCVAQSGELMMLDGRGSFFALEQLDETISARVERGEIHPSGALWGRGAPASAQGVAAIECAIAAQYPELARGLEAVGLQQERRALRLIPRDLSWQWLEPTVVRLEFSLGPGCYATTVLGELLDWEDASGAAALAEADS